MPDITEQLDTERAAGQVPGSETEGQDTTATPYIAPNKPGSSAQTNKQALAMIAILGVVVVLALLFALSHKGQRKARADAKAKAHLGQQVDPSGAANMAPTDEMAPDKQKDDDSVTAQDIERTKDPTGRLLSKLSSSSSSGSAQGLEAGKTSVDTKNASEARPGAAQEGVRGSANAKQLSQIPPFQKPDLQNTHQQQWQPQPYGQQGTAQATSQQQPQESPQDAMRERKDQVTKASLTFTRRPQPQSQPGGPSQQSPTITNFGLRPGFRVAVRLESPASTAITTPVTATVEYNYTRDGGVLIPAGSRVIGKVTSADRQGRMGLTFSSLELPEGYSVPISAVGIGIDMQSVKGQVTGNQRAKGMVLQALSGIGQSAAMMVGTNTNAPFNQSDMMRQNIAQNAGNSVDMQLMQMMANERIVVTVPAGTEMYAVFTKPAATSPSTSDRTVAKNLNAR